MNGLHDLHIMVDLETFSNDARHGVIIAMGAVAFTMNGPITQPLADEYAVSTGGNQFFLPIEVAGQKEYGLCPEPETLQWWFDDSNRSRILASYFSSVYSRSIKEVFETFEQWVQAFNIPLNNTYIWSHGVTYDCMHLVEKWPTIMGKKFDVCSFRHMRDTRTLFAVYEAKFGSSPYPKELMEEPMTHHPLYDSYIQAVAVQVAFNGLL